MKFSKKEYKKSIKKSVNTFIWIKKVKLVKIKKLIKFYLN